MLSRRSFLAALASLPFVGKLIPQADPLTTLEVGDVFTIHGRYAINPQPLKFHPNAFELTMRPLRGETRPRLTFAEWDRTHQA